MTSKDILAIVQDEQAFRVYVVEKLEGHERRLSSLEGRVSDIEAGQSEFRQEVRQRLDGLDYENRLLNSKIDGLQTSVYWGFALLGIIAAILQVFPRKASQPEVIPQPQTQPQPIVIQLPPYRPEQEKQPA